MNVSTIFIGIDEILPTVDAFTDCGYDLFSPHQFYYTDFSDYRWITVMYQKNTDHNLLGVWVK